MLNQDSYGRLLLAQERADRLAEDYGRGESSAARRAKDLARLLSRRRRRQLLRQRAYTA